MWTDTGGMYVLDEELAKQQQRPMAGLLGSMPREDMILGLLGATLNAAGNNSGRNPAEARANAWQGGLQGGLGVMQQSLQNQRAQQQQALQRQSMQQAQQNSDRYFGIAQNQDARAAAREQQQMEEAQRRQALIARLQGLPQTRTEEVRMPAVGPVADPNATRGVERQVPLSADEYISSAIPILSQLDPMGAFGLMGQTAERGAARNERLTARQEDRDFRAQQAEAARQSAIDMQRLRSEDQRTNAEYMARLSASLRQPQAPQIIQSDQGIFALPVGGQGPVPLVGPNGAPLKPKTPDKTLPNNAITELSDRGATAASFSRLADTFKDGFGGYKVGALGDAANTLKRTFGDSTGQAQWWQDYQDQKNVIRNKLFGSALTQTERTEFDKAQITPGMAPTEIRKNLERQREAANAAARKLAGAYRAGGYPQEQIEQALGMPMGAVAPGGAQGGFRVLGRE